ncbi:MAG TPA: ABC transporter substrate-binding protein, partial [Methylomirabilota bacterium]
MTSKRVFWITAVLHCAATFVVVLMVMGWTMVLLDTGHHEAPTSLQALSVVQWALVWPILYPLGRLALSLGYSNPLSPVYWLMPPMNSGAVRRRVAFIPATALIAVLSLVVPLASAQSVGKVPHIGILGGSPGPFSEALRQGLRELGYVEGQNIVLEYRWTDAGMERLPALAAELVRLKVDVIVASSQAAVAARQATTEIPIVMPIITDPVRLGLVSSLARPGGNATGFATQNDELAGKWIELVKETLPRVSRVAVLFQPTYDGGVQLNASEAAARSLGVRMLALTAERPEDFATTFAEVQKHRAEALVVSSSPLFYLNRARLVEFAMKHRLPAIYHQSEFVVESGGLMSYGPDFRDLHRRSASYVDKILKGTKPGDLPVQQPT